jgi:signal transduction histidine kinase
MANVRHRWALFYVVLFLKLFALQGYAQSAASVDSVIQESRKLPPASAVALLTVYLGQVGDPSLEAVIHDRISDAFLEQGILDSAAVHAWRVLRMAPGDNRLVSRAYVRLGFVAYQREAFERAENFYARAARLLTILDDKPALLMALLYEARILDHLDLYAESLQRYEEALQLAGNLGDQALERQMSFELSGVQRKLGKYSDAEDNLLKLLSYKEWDTARIALVWKELGSVHEGRSDYRTALVSYHRLLNLVRRVDPFPGYHQVLRMYIRLNVLDSAQLYADSAETAALTTAQVAYLRDCFRERHMLSRQKQDTIEAYRYLLKYKTFDDSIQREVAARNVQRVRDEQVLSASEALVRITELEAQGMERAERVSRNEEKFLWITTSASLVAVVALSLWFYNLRRSKQRIRTLEEEKKDLSAKNAKVFGVLAKDLQGPLSIYSNLTRSMPSQLTQANPKEASELLANLHRSTQEVQHTLHEILDWAVTQSGTMPFRQEFFSCRNLAEEVVRDLEPWAAEHGVSPMLLVPEHVTAYADRTMVRMVLRTLLYNAIRFSPEGAAVSVFSGKRENLITMGVKDHGPGIAPAKLKSILNWSEESERERGVGLPMCRELVQRNGGDLFVESEEGKGSTFFFTLSENPPGIA